MTLCNFFRWTNGEFLLEDLPEVTLLTHWGYLSYAHLGPLLDSLGSESVMETFDAALPLRRLGICNTARDCALWVGTEGSFTPLHRDSYGFNLVFHWKGTKEWKLWPPNSCQRSFRLPFEESTIWSDESAFTESPLVAELVAGDLLVVPRHWWHLVRATSTSVSTNLWRSLPADINEQVKERLCHLFISALAPEDNFEAFVNTAEERPTVDECTESLLELLSDCDSTNGETSLRTELLETLLSDDILTLLAGQLRAQFGRHRTDNEY